jgi:hypothetical protein
LRGLDEAPRPHARSVSRAAPQPFWGRPKVDDAPASREAHRGIAEALLLAPESSGRAARRAIDRRIPRCGPALIRTPALGTHSGTVQSSDPREAGPSRLSSQAFDGPVPGPFPRVPDWSPSGHQLQHEGGAPSHPTGKADGAPEPEMRRAYPHEPRSNGAVPPGSGPAGRAECRQLFVRAAPGPESRNARRLRLEQPAVRAAATSVDGAPARVGERGRSGLDPPAPVPPVGSTPPSVLTPPVVSAGLWPGPPPKLPEPHRGSNRKDSDRSSACPEILRKLQQVLATPSTMPTSRGVPTPGCTHSRGTLTRRIDAGPRAVGTRQ